MRPLEGGVRCCSSKRDERRGPHPPPARTAVPFTPEQFHYAFANTLSEDGSRAVYERYYVPAPGGFFCGGVSANFTRGHQDIYVAFDNEERASLLLIVGGEDNIMPVAVNQSNPPRP